MLVFAPLRRGLPSAGGMLACTGRARVSACGLLSCRHASACCRAATPPLSGRYVTATRRAVAACRYAAAACRHVAPKAKTRAQTTTFRQK
ncbi:hypothetical protein [Collinsella bouchesdurhonensis]|uniref:hypothetical protein n=1 Tax=Collinsella bouchesdurhonensis TaxID=1907654 RepID=UPI00058DFA09|nr:hypothetical protein [Collinsella bouchesdurhonensis]